jgi:hypothetical protein
MIIDYSFPGWPFVLELRSAFVITKCEVENAQLKPGL